MSLLKRGSRGAEVRQLQEKLNAAGFNPGPVDGIFGLGTEMALIAFQRSENLLPDGIAGPRTLAALNELDPDSPITPPAAPGRPVVEKFTVNLVRQMFPSTPAANIRANLPVVLKALSDASLADRDMILMALATIRAETEGFEPISEFQSRFNTSGHLHPFDLYDNRKDLGNRGAPDGARFKGRGFIQLTGRANYQEHGNAIGLGNQLITNPDLANDPEIAARLLASFLQRKQRRIREALLDRNLKQARKEVNGGSHGLRKFETTFRTGEGLVG